MTLKQAQVRARQLNIVGRSKMNKDQLIRAIAAAETVQNVFKGDRLITKASVEQFSLFLGTKTKGEARKLRKEMRAAGRTDLAAAPRLVGQIRKAA